MYLRPELSHPKQLPRGKICIVRCCCFSSHLRAGPTYDCLLSPLTINSLTAILDSWHFLLVVDESCMDSVLFHMVVFHMYEKISECLGI